MPVFAAPGFLLAGALAALVPLALHLIRRAPPGRAPLPTVRFVEEDPRTAVRVSRPTDPLLLALRMTLLLLLGAGLARPVWLPAGTGTLPLVLLDRGGDADGWRAAVEEARRSLAAGGGLVLFDSAAEVVARERLVDAFFDSLAAVPPAATPGSYAAAFAAVPEAARGLRGADSTRLRLLSPLTEGGWSEGVEAVRARAWPGRVELVRTGSGVPAHPGAEVAGENRSAAVVAAEGGRFAAAALEALGYAVARSSGGELPRERSVYLVLGRDAPPGPELAERAGAGATVILSPRGGEVDAGELWLTPELRLAGAVAPAAEAPLPEGRVLAVREDGRPAVVARRVGTGCVVESAVALEGGELPFQAAYPAALGRLARGCDAAPRASLPLDAGARALLRGTGPAAVPAGAADPERAGTPLGRWLLLGALAVALVETFVAYRPGRSG